MTSFNFSNIKKNKQLLIIAGIILLVLGIAISINLSQKSQESRSQAEGESVDILFDPASQDVAPDAEFTMAIILEGGQLGITGVDVTLDIDTTTADFVSFTPSTTFGDPLINVYKAETHTLRYSAVNPTSNNITGRIELGTLKLKTKTTGEGLVTITHSQVTASGFDTAIPANISASSYTINASTDPTATVEPTLPEDPTTTPALPTDEPTGEPTGEPTAIPTEVPAPTSDGRGGGDNNTGGNNNTGGGNNTPTNTPAGKIGDLNKDGKVNIFDLSILLRNWNKSGIGDLNNDGKVNIFDLSIMLRNWNK